MSLDLVIQAAMNGSVQSVEDQDENPSNLALASDATVIGNDPNGPYQGTTSAPASLTVYAAAGLFPLAVERPSYDDGNRTCFVAVVGGEEAFRFNAYKNNEALNISVGGNQALQIDSSGNLTIPGTMAAAGIQSESSAPSGANLQAVYIDTDTGTLYYHD